MNNLPANLPSVAKAKLPDTYQAAKHAMQQCERVDECKEWADKAAAMASYAKQAQDESLFTMATRIKARAIRQCGDLLKKMEKAQGKRTDREKSDTKLKGGAPPKLSRREAGRAAGLSDDQQKTALRVANVPDDEFEEAVESDSPPTVTELAERGKKPQKRKPDVLKGRDPEDFRAATNALGHVSRIREWSGNSDPAAIARGCDAKERRALLGHVQALIPWLKKLEKKLS